MSKSQLNNPFMILQYSLHSLHSLMLLHPIYSLNVLSRAQTHSSMSHQFNPYQLGIFPKSLLKAYYASQRSRFNSASSCLIFDLSCPFSLCHSTFSFHSVISVAELLSEVSIPLVPLTMKPGHEALLPHAILVAAAAADDRRESQVKETIV